MWKTALSHHLPSSLATIQQKALLNAGTQQLGSNGNTTDLEVRDFSHYNELHDLIEVMSTL